MPDILKNGHVVADGWQLLRPAPAATGAAGTPGAIAGADPSSSAAAGTGDAATAGATAPASATFDAATVPPGRWLVPVAVWRAQRDALIERSGDDAIGIWLAPDDDVDAIAPDLVTRPLVAIDFPKFTDGRGYSIAQRLRVRHRYGGELRAIGNILTDQLANLARVGFDSFALASHHSTETAKQRLAPFPYAYQGSTDDPAPLYRRVARGVEGASS